MKPGTRVAVEVIRALGFVGNSHYCSDCMNTFHDDFGQHKPGCSVLADIATDEDWWGRVSEAVVRADEVTPA